MKTIDLREEKYSANELLVLAKMEAILIRGMDGNTFLLEEADELDREIATLGGSEKFMSFLGQRSKEEDSVPISDIAHRLGIKDA